MLSALAHLALEVKYLDRARAFYADRIGLSPSRATETEVAFPVGDAALVLRRPQSIPRGGLHVHFAFTAPRNEYDEWRDRLADLDPEEATFGDYQSLYVDDPDDHCVEIGGIDDGGTGVTSIFEIVLEVEELAAAEALYTDLGFEVTNRGEQRRRIRLNGPFDLELWEPQLGIADARGGVHVDLGFRCADPAAAANAVGDRATRRQRIEGGVRVRDPDGHYLTFLEP